MLTGSIFLDLTIIFVAVAILAFFAKMFKQPLIPVYIITGILLVPVFNILHNDAFVSAISQFGIVFLLFIAGLELDFTRLKNVTKVSILGGSILVGLLFALGFAVSKAFGFTSISSVYMGLVLSFSSTMVIVKLLSDKNELDSLHGKIGLGLLIVQDVFAIVAFILLSSYQDFSIGRLGWLALIIVAILGGVYLLSKFVFPKLFKFVAESQELLLITAIALCLFFASLFGFFISAEALGIGAFIAGLALANLPYNLEIISRISPLKDFFAMLFFISLGMLLPLTQLSSLLVPTIVFLVLIIMAKPLITFFLVKAFGYMPRVSFLTAISQSQVSEFALILAFFGIATKQISQDLFASIVIIAIVTIALTSYLTQHRNIIFSKLKRPFSPFVKTGREMSLAYLPKTFRKKFVLLVGYDRLGFSILETLKKLKDIPVVVDFNPEVIQQLREDKVNCVYGDVTDSDLLDNLHLKECKLIISTVPDMQASALLIRRFKEINKRGFIFLTSETVDGALKLYKEGADYVIIPRYVGGKHLSLMVKKAKFNVKEIMKNKLENLHELQRRQEHVTRHR
ncbi:hypothetical protein HN592_04185 [Candidatus Woesearchaeota archaeon]|jgi:Kef-type K+ transport system membrane component KefB/Trk K+ transport system NAD-binding subunit|nr:hypothetical protein [Candidatus Woesearchaeota archaeon]MBT4368411.1 hypothetical protein [Candidatus Woesearchaeota archaeon]MBT4712900.1 hypothetical protein [Candidatus Woesearchaeota archaeon]MBT6639812.1 hypothetical protein [Candidatus Woesearchaeota archaeon]MBT7133984.1 hypothetical protein [Candidatus Woesearchaeota archaeon]